MPTMGMSGIEDRVRLASGIPDELSLSFVAQDPDFRVRLAAATNPKMPPILREAIQGNGDFSVESAANIWYDVWQTDPSEFLAEYASDPKIQNILLARGYFAEDYADPARAREWYLVATTIGVLEASANLARLSAADGDLEAARRWATPAARQGNESAQKVLSSLGAASGKSPTGGCYIATAVYGSYDAPPVLTLRRFRDEKLATSTIGRGFVALYYLVSPRLARYFERAGRLNRACRRMLDIVVLALNDRGYGSGQS